MTCRLSESQVLDITYVGNKSPSFKLQLFQLKKEDEGAFLHRHIRGSHLRLRRWRVRYFLVYAICILELFLHSPCELKL